MLRPIPHAGLGSGRVSVSTVLSDHAVEYFHSRQGLDVAVDVVVVFGHSIHLLGFNSVAGQPMGGSKATVRISTVRRFAAAVIEDRFRSVIAPG